MSILSLPIVVVVGSMALAIAGLYLGVRIAGILFGFIGNIIQFVVHEVRDAVLLAATIIRAVFTLPRVLLSVVISSTVIFEIIGPVFTRIAIKRASEQADVRQD